MNSIRNYLNGKEMTTNFVDYRKIFNKNNCVVKGDEININEVLGFKEDEDINLYFNFPWCESRCSFCNYSSGVQVHAEKHEDFVEIMLKHINALKHFFINQKASSVYFGGGTPTILSPKLLDDYVKGIVNIIPLSEDATVTIESNINNLYDDKLMVIKEYANRISVGVQSFDENVRNAANMPFGEKEILKKIEITRKYVDNLNIDLIYGLRYQSEWSFLKDIKRCIEREIPSITLYQMELYEDLEYCSKILLGHKKEEYDFFCSQLFYKAQELFYDAGYIQQPTGWFIKKNETISEQWRKRVDDWSKNRTYLGIGNRAYSHLSDYYFLMEPNYDKWRDQVNENKIPILEFRKKSVEEKALVRLVRILRTEQSITYEDLYYIFDDNKIIIDSILCYFERMQKIKIFNIENQKIKVTPHGLSVMNWIIMEVCNLVISKGETIK